MTSIERLAAVSRGEKADGIPFLPTILEHSAKLLGKTPSEAAVDAQILEAAHIAAYNKYGHDSLTIGIDVYNIEAEALGCTIRYHTDNSIPGVISHPMAEHFDAGSIFFSEDMGRIGLVLEAAARVEKNVGSEVNTSIGICGPFSVAVELYGYENVIEDIVDDGSRVRELLNAVLEFQKSYCNSIIKRGLGITVFESWATPPLISPAVYAEYVMPYERELIRHMKKNDAASAPLVIGGDTSLIVDSIIDTGTTLLVADFDADLAAYVRKAEKNGLLLRGNIDPKLVEMGPADEIINCVDKILQKVQGYPRFVLGTGVIPYSTPPENILLIKNYLEKVSETLTRVHKAL
ncbi:MAG: uroporphyrinogen decarboxylase family protein [Clostridiaceae bacterium]